MSKSEILWEHGDVQIILIQRKSGQCRIFWTSIGGHPCTTRSHSRTLGTKTETDWTKALEWGQGVKNAFLKAQGGG